MTAYAAWQVRQVFNDPAPLHIEVRPNEGSHAAELGMWGRGRDFFTPEALQRLAGG
jgi:hypothetical protein